MTRCTRFHCDGTACTYTTDHVDDWCSAQAQLCTMLEDFLLTSARQLSPTGFVRLSRQGYTLVLSPDHSAITAYSTVHRERTWDQVKHGIPSRFHRHQPRRPSSETPRQTEPVVPLTGFADAFDQATLHLTARVQRSCAKIGGLLHVSDAHLDATHSRLRRAPPQRHHRAAGGRTIRGRARRAVWLVGPDCRALIGVKPVRPPAPIPASPDLPQCPLE